MSQERLGGRVAVVTGGANGIGRAIARRFGQEGAAVIVVDIDADGGREVAAEIDQAGSAAHFWAVDVADGEAMVGALDDTVARFGRLDVLVNNAVAFNAACPDDLDVVATPMEIWDRTYAVNVRGPMVACKHAIPVMCRTGGGVILNVSTTAALRGDVGYVAYSSSKAAMHALTRSIAVSHGRRGIRCNTIATGLVMTAAAQTVASGKLDILRRSRLVDRAGTPEDVAALAAFLASDEARYIIGQTYLIEGGATVNQPWYWGAAEGNPRSYQADGLSGSLREAW